MTVSYWGIDHGEEIAKADKWSQRASDIRTADRVSNPNRHGISNKESAARMKKNSKIQLGTLAGSGVGAVGGGTLGALAGAATRKPGIAHLGAMTGAIVGAGAGGQVAQAKQVRRHYPGYQLAPGGAGMRKITN